jgi:DNA repair exonuclease SbcCD ATPase subunit
MTDNTRAVIGGNSPPDPIEVLTAQYDDIISEAQNWSDGESVTDEAQMNAVDELIKRFKTYRADLTKAAKERTDPLHQAWKSEVAAVRVYTDDADLLQRTLVAAVAPFKSKLAAEKEAARKAAWQAAQDAEREANAKAAAADTANIEAQREAAQAQAAAMEARKTASAAQKDTVKGMRTVHYHDIADMRALVNWIATNDKFAMAAFAEAYAARNHKDIPDAVVRSWTAKEAF